MPIDAEGGRQLRSTISRREWRHREAQRKRKPKRQGSRDQVGKKVPRQYPRTRMPVRNMTYQPTERTFRRGQ